MVTFQYLSDLHIEDYIEEYPNPLDFVTPVSDI